MVGGRNIVPRLAQNTIPRPIARGPPQVRNLSLGAHTATVDNPPTIPAVYHAARVRIGPPTNIYLESIKNLWKIGSPYLVEEIFIPNYNSLSN